MLFFNQSLFVENGKNSLVIFCADTSGKMLWQKTYYGKRVRVQRAFVTSANTVLLGGVSFTEEAIWMAEIDSPGSILWEKTLLDTTEYPGGFPVSINNSKFWFGARAELNKLPYAYLYKSDNLGNLTWAKK